MEGGREGGVYEYYVTTLRKLTITRSECAVDRMLRSCLQEYCLGMCVFRVQKMNLDDCQAGQLG